MRILGHAYYVCSACQGVWWYGATVLSTHMRTFPTHTLVTRLLPSGCSIVSHSVSMWLLCVQAAIGVIMCSFSFHYPSGREAAVKIGQDLCDGHFIHHVTFDHEFKDEKLFYRILGDGHLRALNAKLSYACIPRPGTCSAHFLSTLCHYCLT